MAVEAGEPAGDHVKLLLDHTVNELCIFDFTDSCIQRFTDSLSTSSSAASRTYLQMISMEQVDIINLCPELRLDGSVLLNTAAFLHFN